MPERTHKEHCPATEHLEEVRHVAECLNDDEDRVHFVNQVMERSGYVPEVAWDDGPESLADHRQRRGNGNGKREQHKESGEGKHEEKRRGGFDWQYSEHPGPEGAE